MAVWSSVRLSQLGGAYRLDPEFWRPEYLTVDSALRKLRHDTLGNLAISLRKGVFNILADSYVESGVPFYRSSSVGAVIPKSAERVFITPERHKAESKTALKRGDLMLSKTGKEGASVVLEPECNVSQDVIAVRLNRRKVNPFYVAVFLNTRSGTLQMRRWFQGQVQMHLALPDARKLLIPLPDDTVQERAQAIVEQHEKSLRLSERLVVEAQHLLLTGLGLDGLDLSPRLCYSRPFQDLLAAGRFGAEYFMPAKDRALRALGAIPHRLVVDHFEPIKDLFQPEKAGKGDFVRNYDVSDALAPFLDEVKEPTPALEVGSTKKRFVAGDVVVSRLRSYLKEIAVVRTPSNVPCVGSSELIVLRPRRAGGHGLKRLLSAQTLVVYLRSVPVQVILEWSQDGSNHPRFTEEDLMAIPVPEAVVEMVPAIDRLLDESINARQDAARLLHNAKEMVEEAVLGKVRHRE